MDFLHRVSYSVGSYVNHQRNWATNIDNQNPQENINSRDIDNNLPALVENHKCYLGNNLLYSYRQFYNT